MKNICPVCQREIRAGDPIWVVRGKAVCKRTSCLVGAHEKEKSPVRQHRRFDVRITQI